MNSLLFCPKFVFPNYFLQNCFLYLKNLLQFYKSFPDSPKFVFPLVFYINTYSILQTFYYPYSSFHPPFSILQIYIFLVVLRWTSFSIFINLIIRIVLENGTYLQ